MYYVSIVRGNRAELYACEPEAPHFVADELPYRPYDKAGHMLVLCGNLGTAEIWWEYIKNAPPGPPPPDPLADLDALTLDHEFRLTLLELGV